MYPTAGQNIELLCYEHAILQPFFTLLKFLASRRRK